jgi:hypothetical protein
MIESSVFDIALNWSIPMIRLKDEKPDLAGVWVQRAILVLWIG